MDLVEQIKTWRCRASMFGDIVIDGDTITAKQLEELNRLIEKPNPTDKQLITIEELTKKRDAPPTLSTGAKTVLREIYNEMRSGVSELIVSKYFEKGITVEPDCIELAKATIHPDIDGLPHGIKYESEWLRGTPDIRDDENLLVQITDTKAAWSLNTLNDAEFKKIYYWQGVAYLHLTGLNRFGLLYCLIDNPPHLIKREQEYHFNQNSHKYLHENDPAYLKWCLDYEESVRYSKYPIHERFKFWTLDWEPRFQDVIETTITAARKYLFEYHVELTERHVKNFELIKQQQPNLFEDSEVDAV